MSDEGGAFITQDSWSGRDLAGAGPEVTGSEYIQNGFNHAAAHYSADFSGSNQLTTFHCTAPF